MCAPCVTARGMPSLNDNAFLGFPDWPSPVTSVSSSPVGCTGIDCVRRVPPSAHRLSSCFDSSSGLSAHCPLLLPMPSPSFPPLLACLPPGIWRGGPRVEARVFPCHAGRIDGTLPGAAPLFRKDSSPNLAAFSHPALAVCVCVAERLPSFVGDALLHRSIPRPPFWCAVSTSLVLAFADSYLLFVFYCRFVLIADSSAMRALRFREWHAA